MDGRHDDTTVTNRRENLRSLAERVARRENVRDAWLAKSFTDRLFVVEVGPDATLPTDVETELRDAGLRGADEVYDEDAPDAAYAGRLEDARRYRFVDCETRGDLQSYVVE